MQCHKNSFDKVKDNILQDIEPINHLSDSGHRQLSHGAWNLQAGHSTIPIAFITHILIYTYTHTHTPVKSGSEVQTINIIAVTGLIQEGPSLSSTQDKPQ